MWKALQEGIGDVATSAKNALEEGSRILNDMDNSLVLRANRGAEKGDKEMDFSKGEPMDESITQSDTEKELEERSRSSSAVNEMSSNHVDGRSRALESATYYDAKNQSELLMEDVSGTTR